MRAKYGAVDTEERGDGSAQSSSEAAGRPQSPLTIQLLFLLLMCLMCLTPHYGKHSISALAPSLIKELSIRRAQFGLIFSIQEIPNILLPILGGFLLSRANYGIAAVILSLLMAVGQVLCAFAVQQSSVDLMLFGRLVFGLGDSLSIMLEYSIINRWFASSYLSMAFGVALLASRLGSFSGFAFPGILEERFGLHFAMWMAVAVSLFSLSAATAYYAIEKKFWEPTPINGESGEGHTRFRALGSALSLLSLTFWLVTLLWATLAASFFCLLDYFTDILVSRERATAAHAGLVSGLILGFAALISPLSGYFVDRRGNRPLLIGLSMLLLAAGIYMLKEDVSLLIAVLLISISFGLGPVTLLSCVAIAVPTTAIPVALGFYKASQNAGLAITHYLAGELRDRTGSYQSTLAFFTALACVGLIMSALLHIRDLTSQHRLLSKVLKQNQTAP